MTRIVGSTLLPGKDFLQVMIVFTKTDVYSYKSILELKMIMRLNHITSTATQEVKHTTFNIEQRENLQNIREWCFKTAGQRMTMTTAT